MPDIHTKLSDGTPAVFVGSTWEDLGEQFAVEDRAAHWREDEERSQAAHEAFFAPAQPASTLAKPAPLTRCPSCAALVESIFDHVDIDCAHD